MEVKRIFKKEQKFIIMSVILAFIIFSISITVCIIIYNHNNYFKFLVENKNYSKLYESIDNPDFSIGIFKKYFNNNFGNAPKFILKSKNQGYTNYVFNSSSGTKTIKTISKKGKIKWIFDDYVYNWAIKLPSNAEILVAGVPYDNNNGEVDIKKIPSGIYEVSCSISGISSFNEKISAGQNISIDMKLNDEAKNSIQTIIKKFMEFKENIINGKNETAEFIDKNSGLYNEMSEQALKMKSLDYKVSYSLKDFSIGEAKINDNGDIVVNVDEKWNTIIENDAGKSEKINEYKNIYYLKYNGSFIIQKVDTEN